MLNMVNVSIIEQELTKLTRGDIMFSVLFHKDVFMPEGVQDVVMLLQRKMTAYQLSYHLQEHLNNQKDEDRSHTYLYNAVVNNLNQILCGEFLTSAFEVELTKIGEQVDKYANATSWVISKYCIRVSYSYSQDLVIVIRPKYDTTISDFRYDTNLVVTAWINHKKDAHRTLDASKYCSSEEWSKINEK